MPSGRVQRRIDSLLDDAEQAIAGNDWTVVLERVRSVLVLEPENADAVFYRDAAERETNGAAADDAERDVEDVVAEPATGADMPSSFADGRYEIIKFLGEGGKKKVYLAKDTVLDREIAFALIKMDGLDDVGRTRVNREAQAMGRLGTHPNVVAVFDIGEHEGQPWMVNELLGGGDVEEMIEDAAGPLDLKRSLEIATDTLRGLEFAHSKGIIHRDIKPANVWLTDDGTAKVGDYGLAIATDRSRLTQEKMMIGTVSYMPPEQATGGEITPKADLYSLGAMLYEMVTGRPPFLGDNEIAIIGQHINTPPVAPQWHQPEIPSQLDSLIMRLLSKNPAERPDSAADVLSSLEAIDATPREIPVDTATGKSGSLDAMASGVFVGRHREMDQLKASLENALSGRGGMVTLVGEPGIGKTRTALELETYAGLRNATVLWGRCYEGTGAPPYWPWVQAIRSYVSSLEPEELRSQMGSTASVIAEIVEDVKQKLPETEPPVHLDNPESARFRLFDSIATFLKNAGKAKPIVLVLDDLHWSDKPSLMLLEFVARELASSRVMLIGTYRDMELNRRHPLTVTLGDLSREHLFERVLLRGLTREDVARFIEIAAGVTPPKGLIDAVHTQSEGNPLFVTEIVRLFVQEGELTPEKLASRDSWDVRTPEGVREVIGRRLDKLSERTNEVLTAAAIIGRQFTLDEIDAVSEDTTRERLLDVVDEGLAARVIEEFSSTVGQYQFSHAVIQETLGDELSLTRRVTVHARIAEALEKLYADSIHDHAETLAFHFEQAQTILGSEKMIKYSIIAGHSALDTLGYDEALIHFTKAYEPRDADPVDDQLAEILFGLGRATVASVVTVDGQDRGLGYLLQAFDFYSDKEDRATAAKVASVSYIGVLRPAGVDLSKRTLEYLGEDSVDAVHVNSRMGLQLAMLGHEQGEALEYVDRAIDTARKEGLIDAEAWGLYRKSMIYSWTGDNPRSISIGLEAIEVASAAHDVRAAMLAHNQLSISYMVTGAADQAVHHQDVSLSLARQSKDSTRIAQSLMIASFLDLFLGKFEEFDYFDEIGAGGAFEAAFSLNNAWRLVERNEIAEARQFAIKGSEIIRSEDSWGDSILTGLVGGAVIADRAGITDVRSSIESLLERTRNWNAMNRAARTTIHALFALADGKDTNVSEIYSEMEGIAGRAWAGSADTILARLARLLDRPDDAEKHFEDAIEFCKKAPYPPELAWAQYHYSDFLLDRDASGDPSTGSGRDHEKATELQDGAISIATELGMKLLLEKVLSQREILKA